MTSNLEAAVPKMEKCPVIEVEIVVNGDRSTHEFEEELHW